MGIERAIHRPIAVENIENHERELTKKLELIQLVYADDQFQKQVERENAFQLQEEKITKFSDLLNNCTATGQTLMREHEERTNGKKGAAEFRDKVMEKIDVIYERKSAVWQHEIIDCIAEECGSLGEKPTQQEKRNHVGILHYEIEKDNRNLQEYGMGGYDKVLEIHLEELYKQKNEGGLTKLKKSLEELAGLIVKEHPEVEKIFARSWIMDSSLSSRLGFETIARTPSLTHGSTWWQFIDKDGQIDKNRLNQFMKTGELPFQVAAGKMDVVEFLKKYLPKDKRGDIILKEMTLETKERKAALDKIRREFPHLYDAASQEAIPSIFETNEIFSSLKQKGKLDELIKFLLEMKEKDYSWNDVVEKEDARLNEISQVLVVDLLLEEYVEKKVHIE